MTDTRREMEIDKQEQLFRRRALKAFPHRVVMNINWPKSNIEHWLVERFGADAMPTIGALPESGDLWTYDNFEDYRTIFYFANACDAIEFKLCCG